MSETNVEKVFLELLTFSNEAINPVFYELFQGESVKTQINKKGEEEQYFLRVHFIKTFNLHLAITALFGLENYPLPDEAKIILRSLFEHISNFFYIYLHDEDEKKTLINRFFAYQNLVSRFSFFNQQLRDLQNPENDTQKELLAELQELDRNINFSKKEKEFKEKYVGRNEKAGTWHGKDTRTFFGFLYEKKEAFLGDNFRRMQKTYVDCNSYVHCNIMDYYDELCRAFVGNFNIKDCIITLREANLLLVGYIEIFFKIIDIDMTNPILKKYFDSFEEISEKTYNIIKNNS